MTNQATTSDMRIAPPALVTRSEDMPAGAEQAAVRAARLVAFAPQPELHLQQQHAPFPWRSILSLCGDFLWSLGQWKRSD